MAMACGIWYLRTKSRVQKFCIQWQIFIMFIYVVNEWNADECSFVCSSFHLHWFYFDDRTYEKVCRWFEMCSTIFHYADGWQTDGELTIDGCYFVGNASPKMIMVKEQQGKRMMRAERSTKYFLTLSFYSNGI